MGANNTQKTEEIWEYDEKMKKRDLVINTIKQRSAFSDHKILQEIHKATASPTGSDLEATVLSGGKYASLLNCYVIF